MKSTQPFIVALSAAAILTVLAARNEAPSAPASTADAADSAPAVVLIVNAPLVTPETPQDEVQDLTF
jgi:hypothetical protein